MHCMDCVSDFSTFDHAIRFFVVSASRTSHRSSCSISESTTADQPTSNYNDITIDIIEEALKSVEGQHDTDDDDDSSDRDDNSTPFVRYLPLQRKDLSSFKRKFFIKL